MTDPRIPPALEGATTALHRRIAELTAELEQKTAAVAEAIALLDSARGHVLNQLEGARAEAGHEDSEGLSFQNLADLENESLVQQVSELRESNALLHSDVATERAHLAQAKADLTRWVELCHEAEAGREQAERERDAALALAESHKAEACTALDRETKTLRVLNAALARVNELGVEVYRLAQDCVAAETALASARAVEQWLRSKGDPTGISGDYGMVHATTAADKLAEALTSHPAPVETDVCGKKCDHGSECLLLRGHDGGHDTQHGCTFYDANPLVRIQWQCGSCAWGFFGPLQEQCPGCGAGGFWSGSVRPDCKPWPGYPCAPAPCSALLTSHPAPVAAPSRMAQMPGDWSDCDANDLKAPLPPVAAPCAGCAKRDEKLRIIADGMGKEALANKRLRKAIRAAVAELELWPDTALQAVASDLRAARGGGA
jgi:hypothetical protein